MKSILKLKNPIMINGKSVDELPYDAKEITVQQFAKAEESKLRAAPNSRAGAVEIDYGMQLYLGFEAMIAVDSSIDITDLERIKGSDVVEVMRIGRNFIMGKSEEPSEESTSDEPSGITQKPSTLLS